MQIFALLATFAAILCQLCHAGYTPIVGALAPWKVTSIQIRTPSMRRPGPIAVDLIIENPNSADAGTRPHAEGGGYFTFDPSNANCTITTRGHHCTETTNNLYSTWTIGLSHPLNITRRGGGGGGGFPFDPRNIGLKFTLTYNMTRMDSALYKVYEGIGHFGVGLNLTQGACDYTGGTCMIGLASKNKPLLIFPKLKACQGTCAVGT
ncbi:uncharacterized protein GGS25DRAFT_487488 [Hypoxylon fragiforme]|uniref:uncharacterized protein n=1 Tax=Hypoxylon fragiforme TaxID=63214 RepID=UPI0020C6D816|nr:uncharacterized protein GGS25DRAFT_487488 [Hypoxylon fragiforme]KAI2610112.1 hypothetical protein GGS25DRAFT_487488 [Hypoxylon fragiforme]